MPNYPAMSAAISRTLDKIQDITANGWDDREDIKQNAIYSALEDLCARILWEATFNGGR
jgi:hypothetical protein